MISKYWKHFLTICRHRAIVGRECNACGIPLLGLLHDLSKFSVIEFAPSARYFQGNGSPIEKEKALKGYSVAWLHHKGHNKHHWEWWTDFDKNGNIIANKIPSKYVIEMACDFVGAGIAYSKDEWTQDEPFNYYMRVKDGRHLNEETEKLFINLLKTIRDKGLNGFHSLCKDKSFRKEYDLGGNYR